MSWTDQIEPELRQWIATIAPEEFTIDEFHAHCEPFIETGFMNAPPNNNAWGGLAKVTAAKTQAIDQRDASRQAAARSVFGNVGGQSDERIIDGEFSAR